MDLVLCLMNYHDYNAFFNIDVSLDRNPGLGYNSLLLQLIPGDLLSACSHRQFHTLSTLFYTRAALSNSHSNALRAMQGGSLYHFYDGLRYDPAGTRTHDLPHERRTRYPLSQLNTVKRYGTTTLDYNVLYCRYKTTDLSAV